MLVQPVTLGAQDDGRGWGELHGVVVVLPALVQAVDPKSLFLQLIHGTVQVDGLRDRSVLQGAGRGLGHGFREARSAPLGDDHRPGSGGIRRPNDRAQIVRILDPVQQDHEPHLRPYVLDGQVLLRRSKGDHALVRGTRRHALDLFSRLEPDRDAATAAKINDFLDARSAGALGYEHAVHWATGGQCLTYGVYSYKD